MVRNFEQEWGKPEKFLVEEREDLNRRSIEQSLRSAKTANQLNSTREPLR